MCETLMMLIPQAVVHCAAERRPDVCEKEPELTKQMNVDVPAHLARLCNASGVPQA